MSEEKYKFFNNLLDLFNKLLDKFIFPFFRWIYIIVAKKKNKKDKIKEMSDFIQVLNADRSKVKILNDIMKMPDFGTNLRKKLGQTQKDADKIFFIRFWGIKPNLERWLSQEWDFAHNTYYISIHPLFLEAYKKWQKNNSIIKKRKKTK